MLFVFPLLTTATTTCIIFAFCFCFMNSYSIHYGKLYITIINFVSVTVAMYCLVSQEDTHTYLAFGTEMTTEDLNSTCTDYFRILGVVLRDHQNGNCKPW